MMTADENGRRPGRRDRARGIDRYAIAVALGVLLGACDNAESAADELTGDWQSQGYGVLLRADDDKVQLIEWTPVSCLSAGKYSAERFQSRFKVRLESNGTRFEVHNDGTLSGITFTALDEGDFDRLCPSGLTPRSDDPELNFDVLWQTFNQHYAFFAQRNVDWDAMNTEYRPEIDEDTSDGDLRRIFRKMLTPLDDGHVALYIRNKNVLPDESRLFRKLRAECRDERDDGCNVDRFIEKRYASFEKTLRATYLQNDFKTALDGAALWGKIGNAIGYFRIDEMSDLTRERDTSANNLAALNPVLDDMLEDIGELPNMIIDVRLNGGGYDTVALAIAARFTDRRRVFGTKQAFDRNHRTPRHELVITPADGPQYRGRVALLTSSETASAAEVFALAMRSLPQVTLVGQPTMGIFSDALYRTLPNRWNFTLSNEIYRTAKGETFEGTGVPPTVVAPFLSAEDDEDGVDSIIDAAVATLRQRNRP